MLYYPTCPIRRGHVYECNQALLVYVQAYYFTMCRQLEEYRKHVYYFCIPSSMQCYYICVFIMRFDTWPAYQNEGNCSAGSVDLPQAPAFIM